MSPIRRYLRITKYSVLEVRVYLDDPSDAPWLLSTRDPVLNRIIDEIRPTVLPKLREENENAKRKGSKKKRGIKDVASQDDFEVTIFLTETSTRHSLLTKRKHFSDKPKLASTGNKLTGWLNNSENPIDVEDDDAPPTILAEGDDDDVVALHEIPEVQQEEDTLFVRSSDEETFQTQRERANKRQRRRKDVIVDVSDHGDDNDNDDDADDKKKFNLSTFYDGFSIFGRVLCLVVKRKGSRNRPASAALGGSEMMENWVSTQANQDAMLDEDGDG